jgi:hypothetical protein
MVGLSPFISKVLWGVLIVLFGVVMIFVFIIHNRMMRKPLMNDSRFSRFLNLRSLGTRDFYLFILLICIGALIVMAMRLLKESGI